MKKWAISFLIPLCLLICAFVFVVTQPSGQSTTIPNEVTVLIENYMNAYKNGTAKAAEYIHFEDEFKKSAYILSGDRLLAYKIESAEKINDNLYGFVILVKTEQTEFYSGDVYERVYNFVARIQDKWCFLNGVSNIPTELRDNLDVKKYTYIDENIVDSGDIVDIIELD